ncbi:MAG: MerR family transcriptional regulator [Bryobacteraceae bacterium]|jgi:DNA-binding transcriptional MerR regulator
MNQPKIRPEPPTEIPEKLYFRIGEVSRLVGVPPYVLRYWESEFPGLAPKKSGTGHRFYRRKDVELLLQIKQLLYEKRFTIEGARRHLEVQPKRRRRERPAKPGQADLFSASPESLRSIREELASILGLLK